MTAGPIASHNRAWSNLMALFPFPLIVLTSLAGFFFRLEGNSPIRGGRG